MFPSDKNILLEKWELAQSLPAKGRIAIIFCTLLGTVWQKQVRQYTVKKVYDFPVPSRDVTNRILPGRE